MCVYVRDYKLAGHPPFLAACSLARWGLLLLFWKTKSKLLCMHFQNIYVVSFAASVIRDYELCRLGKRTLVRALLYAHKQKLRGLIEHVREPKAFNTKSSDDQCSLWILPMKASMKDLKKPVMSSLQASASTFLTHRHKNNDWIHFDNEIYSRPLLE